MMKFFRKYNKHLLAVFMALLLVIWLGGQALEEFIQPNPNKAIIGTAISGEISAADRNIAENLTQLQERLGFSWQTLLRNPNAKPDEQLDMIDWILLVREAKRYGIDVSTAQAQNMLEGARIPRADVERLATIHDVAPERFYEAAAQFFAVQRMIRMFQDALQVPEPELRLLARNILERASVELIVLPAKSFSSPEETFTEAELTPQFEAHKAKVGQPGSLNFGYFIEPHVQVQYIKIDPEKIKDHLRSSDNSFEKRAYLYWKENQQDPRFQRTPAELKALRESMADATTNGAEQPTPAAEPERYYKEFSEAREKALEAVKITAAKAEADRIAVTLVRALAEPWYATAAERNEFKPAPEQVKQVGYYDEVIATIPPNLRYPEGVESGILDNMTERELSELGGVGSASHILPDNQRLPLSALAFNVEGLVTIPDEPTIDRSMYLSQWMTFPKPLSGMDGATYLFRVVSVEPGREPRNVDEVADRVADDLRLLRGMERAKAAAEEFVSNIGTNGLKEAWEANVDLNIQVTPDRGGYVTPSPFSRDSSPMFGGMKNMVMSVGKVTDEFIEQAFTLAAEGESSKLAIVELPDEASVTIIKGKKLLPLYEENYEKWHDSLQSELSQRKAAEILLNWLNAKHIRERNEWKLGEGA